jgi:C1A family cysteine protease
MIMSYLLPNIQRFKSSVENNGDKVYQPTNQLLKDKIDLREWDSLVENQAYLGSCTGQAVSNAYELMVKKQYPEKFTELSEMFIYYNARSIDGTVSYDAGASIRDSLIGLKKYGVCSDSLWPYDIEKFNIKPSDEAYSDALPRCIPEYFKLITIGHMMDALNNGYPVVIGMTIFESFMHLDKDNPIVKERDYYDAPIGGHAVCVVGYDASTKLFIAKNSYGSEWGINGYFYIPFDYVEDYVFEKWIFDIPENKILVS